MLPIIQIGSVRISTYWLMLSVGAVGMWFCLRRRRVRFSLSIWQCVYFTILLTVIGFAGAKLLFILENFRSTLENGISLGGLSFFGSVFLIPLLMPLIGRLFGLQRSQTMDICGPCVAIMIGCMRVGCFLQGCCGGWELCMGSFCFTWPTQMLESVGDFAIMAWLLQWEDSGKGKGKLYPILMVGYSTMRFFIEFLRETRKDWLHLSRGQWFSLAAVFVGVLWIKVIKRTNNIHDI